MGKILCQQDYEESLAASRPERLQWFRAARFGMFVHYGLYSQLGRNEWVMAMENIPVAEYEQYAENFRPKEGAAAEWAALAKKAGMKYMVLTTRHHEGFSLWDSKVNPYNSVNYGSKRDLVKEFVEACRANDLRIGFYSSLMDWHHPDSWRCAFDSAARQRFNDYITELNRELLTQYGKIDLLWYDVPRPLQTSEGWNSLERNQILRELQPDIIINNRSRLAEDLGTPEGRIAAEEGDWEACMTFNDLSWGYIDSAQAAPYSYNAQRIVKMLCTTIRGGGNLLLNIGPAPDGSVPPEAVEPLGQVGAWLAEHQEAVYGPSQKFFRGDYGIGFFTRKENTYYGWTFIWPNQPEMLVAGFRGELQSARLLSPARELSFTQEEDSWRLRLQVPEKCPETKLGITVIALEFAAGTEYIRGPAYPQLRAGKAHMDE